MKKITKSTKKSKENEASLLVKNNSTNSGLSLGQKDEIANILSNISEEERRIFDEKSDFDYFSNEEDNDDLVQKKIKLLEEFTLKALEEFSHDFKKVQAAVAKEDKRLDQALEEERQKIINKI